MREHGDAGVIACAVETLGVGHPDRHDMKLRAAELDRRSLAVAEEDPTSGAIELRARIEVGLAAAGEELGPHGACRGRSVR